TRRGTSAAVGSLTCPQPPHRREMTWYSVTTGGGGGEASTTCRRTRTVSCAPASDRSHRPHRSAPTSNTASGSSTSRRDTDPAPRPGTTAQPPRHRPRPRLLPRLTSRPRPRRPFLRRLLRPRRIRRRRTGGITRIRPPPTLQLRDPLIPLHQRSPQLRHLLIPLRHLPIPLHQRRFQPTHPREQPLNLRLKRPRTRHPMIIPGPRATPDTGVTTRSTT